MRSVRSLNVFRAVFVFLAVPFIQRELDEWRIVRNNSRKRHNRNSNLPNEAPCVIEELAPKYGPNDGIPIPHSTITNEIRMLEEEHATSLQLFENPEIMELLEKEYKAAQICLGLLNIANWEDLWRIFAVMVAENDSSTTLQGSQSEPSRWVRMSDEDMREIEDLGMP